MVKKTLSKINTLIPSKHIIQSQSKIKPKTLEGKETKVEEIYTKPRILMKKLRILLQNVFYSQFIYIVYFGFYIPNILRKKVANNSTTIYNKIKSEMFFFSGLYFGKFESSMSTLLNQF